MNPLRLLLAFALALGFATPFAAAQEADPVERARVYFTAGMAYFDDGEYERAIPQFERALELTTAPEILYNLYVAHERIGQFEQATVYLRSYLSVGASAEERPALQARLDALERRAAQHSTDPTTEATDTPAPQRELSADAAPREDAPPPEAPPTDGPSMAPAIAAFGVGAAGLITFAVAGGIALSRDGELAETCGADTTRTCSEDDTAGLRRATITADVGLAVGLVGVALGTILAIVAGGNGDDDDAHATLAPTFDRRSAGMVLRGSF